MFSSSFISRGLRATLLGLSVSLLLTAPAEAKKVALLVGVSNYPLRPGMGQSPSLAGPANDIRSMKAALQEGWGLAESDIVTLTDAQATRDNILKALEALPQRTAPGDEVLIYFSGHGTSALDADSGQNVPKLSQGTGAFIPYDYQFVIGRVDILPRIQKIDADRKIWIISDSCYSKNQARGLAPAVRPGLAGRFLALPEADQKAMAARLRNLPAQKNAPYPYKNTVFLAAAAEGEIARDLNDPKLEPTIDGLPHGALTDALLRIFKGQTFADYNGDHELSADEIIYAAQQTMSARALPQQAQLQPAAAEDARDIKGAPFFGGGLRSMAKQRPSMALEKIRIALDPRANLPSELAERLQKHPGVELADNKKIAAEFNLSKVGSKLLLFSAADALVAEFSSVQAFFDKLAQESWSKTFKKSILPQQKGVLPLEFSPNHFGSSYAFGEKIQVGVKPPKDITLMMLNIDSAGKISVLYPLHSGEAEKIRAGQFVALPQNQGIEVGPPEGTDQFYAIGFLGQAPDLSGLYGRDIVALGINDPRIARLGELVSKHPGGILFNAVELKTYAK